MKRIKIPLILSLLLVAILAVFAAACTPSETPTKPTHAAEHYNPYKEAEDEGEQSEYNVVFNTNYSGAATPTVQKVAKGNAVSEQSAPEVTRSEYSFTGWYTDKECSVKYDFSSAVNKNIVLFAGWKSGTVSVRFNYNYVGGPDIERISVAPGETVSEPTEPSRTHYEFKGWSNNANGGSVFDFATKIENDITLYAQWKLTDADVIFDVAAEDSTAVEASNVNIGSKITRPADPQRDAYNFANWTTSTGEIFNFDTVVTEQMVSGTSITLTATWTIKTYTVTFDWNGYTGTPTNATVEHGKTVSEPESNRTGYVCVWQLNGTDYNFGTGVTGDITLKAVWTAESSDNVTVTFYMNYDGAPNGGVYKTETVKLNYRVNRPDPEPERAGYYFDGWYTTAECTQAFDFNARLKENASAYAKWLTRYTFEAEYVDLTDKYGFGFSVNLFETDLIMKDNGTCNASNGYYVTGLYYEGAEIEFNIVSDKEVDNAVVIIRVQVEYDSKTFNPDLYTVAVNGVALDYNEFHLEAEEADSRLDDRRPFIEVEMTTRAHLVAGNNKITLTTTNDIMHGNTRKGDAPMIDCIYVCTDANLSWTPKESNLAGKE